MTVSPKDMTLIMPVYNSQNTLPHALASLKSQTLCPAKIILVDNASTDNSRLLLEAFQNEFTRCEVILLHEAKPGPSAARNRAIGAAETPLLGFLDSDMSLHADWVKNAVAYFNTHPEVDAVAGVTEGFATPDAFQNFQSFYRRDFAAGELTDWREAYSKGFLTFANAACRRSFFDKAGLLPEDYWVGEDLYVNIRALQNRAIIRISEPTLLSYHYEKYTLLSFLTSRFRYRMALGRVIRTLNPGFIIFRHGRIQPFPITAWVGNPLWCVGAVFFLLLLFLKPLLLLTLPLWIVGFSLVHIVIRSRTSPIAFWRIVYYTLLQSAAVAALLWAQCLAFFRYGIIMI